MAIAATAAYVIHLVFAALLSVTVLYVAWARPSVVDAANRTQSLVSRLLLVSRTSAVVLLLSGGYLLSAFGYVPGSRLTGSTDGYLVILMAVLWALLIGVNEVAGARLKAGRDAQRFLFVAAGLVVLLLADAGILAGG